MSFVRFSTGPSVVASLLLVAGQATSEQKGAGKTGQLIYDRDCATCHGPEGKGDGETAAYLTPQPQDFTTGILQKRSDEFLIAVISKGGSAKDLAESMPGFPKLSKADLRSVVAYVRELGKGGARKAK